MRYDALVAIGANAVAVSIAGLLATCLCRLGRYEEAEELVAVARGAEDDVNAQAFSRTARAKVLAARGEAAAGVQVAREATSVLRNTDVLAEIGYVAEVLAELLEKNGQLAEAREAAEDALVAYERKEHLVGAERVRLLLDRLAARSVR